MKVNKAKSLTLLITVIIICIGILTGCNSNSSSNTSESKTTSPESTTSPETFETGNISTVVPDGWKAFGTTNSDGKSDPNTINISKGAKSDLDMLSRPGVYIYYYGPGTTFFSAGESFYDDYVEQTPVTIGDRTWNYHTYTSIGYPYAELIWEDKEKNLALQVNILLENKPYKISLDDEDVRAIIQNLKIIDPDAK